MKKKQTEVDNEYINYLMKVRREALEKYGSKSSNFIDIDRKFQKYLNKYNLEHTELIIGWLPRKP